MALSQEQFNQLLLDAEDSTGFGINRYNELKALGATNEQIAQIAANAPVIGPKAREALPELQDIFYTRIRGELENQYNNLVALDPSVTYKGRASDLPTIFNQQARQLASAGVSSITNLRQGSEDIRTGERFGNVVIGQNPILIDQTTGQKVSTTNLGGSIAVDRDTGAQKFGDIFSGVEGGANYGISFDESGSAILYPVWEKSKSLTQQVLQSDLFKAASIGLAAYGLYNLGSALATAGGAEAVAAAGSGLTPSAGGVTGLTPGAAGVTGITAPAGTVLAPSVGATVAGAAGATAALEAPSFGLLDGVDFSRIGETGLTPGAGEGFQAAAGAAPGIPSMGGAQGITVPVAGGTIAQSGFIPATQAAALGGGSEFGVTDALRLANQAQSLFGGQPQIGGLLGGQRGGGQPMGVDYSGLLSLLQSRTATPNVAPLLAPAVNPYQPLLGATNLSLLG